MCSGSSARVLANSTQLTIISTASAHTHTNDVFAIQIDEGEKCRDLKSCINRLHSNRSGRIPAASTLNFAICWWDLGYPGRVSAFVTSSHGAKGHYSTTPTHILGIANEIGRSLPKPGLHICHATTQLGMRFVLVATSTFHLFRVYAVDNYRTIVVKTASDNLWATTMFLGPVRPQAGRNMIEKNRHFPHNLRTRYPIHNECQQRHFPENEVTSMCYFFSSLLSYVQTTYTGHSFGKGEKPERCVFMRRRISFARRNFCIHRKMSTYFQLGALVVCVCVCGKGTNIIFLHIYALLPT